MATKRTSSSSKKAPSRRRISAASTPIPESQPIYSADEKRQLILAHAAMRAPHDPVQLMSAWAGVAVALLVVAAGWWWASGTMIVHTASSVGSDVQEAFREAPSVTKQAGFGSINVSQSLKDASDKLRVMNAEAATRQQALDHMAQLVASSTSDTQRQDVFKPGASTSTTSTSLLKP